MKTIKADRLELYKKAESLIAKGQSTIGAAKAVGVPNSSLNSYLLRGAPKKTRSTKKVKPSIQEIQLPQRQSKLLCLLGTPDEIVEILRKMQ